MLSRAPPGQPKLELAAGESVLLIPAPKSLKPMLHVGQLDQVDGHDRFEAEQNEGSSPLGVPYDPVRCHPVGPTDRFEGNLHDQSLVSHHFDEPDLGVRPAEV